MKLTQRACHLVVVFAFLSGLTSCRAPGSHGAATPSEASEKSQVPQAEPVRMPKELPVDPSIRKILITGAAGTVGSTLVRGLRERYEIRGLDIRPMPELEDSVVGSILDFDVCFEATKDIDAVIHLVNIRTKRDDADWLDCRDNMLGTRNVFEAARQNGVRRIGYSSETGVLSGLPMDVQRRADLPTRPHGGYPLSKVFAEQLGFLYAARHGIGFVSVRIGRIDPDGKTGSGTVEPLHPYDLTHADCVRVFERAVVHPGVKHEIVFGVSDSTWELYDLNHGRRVINYFPQDKSVIEPEV